MPTPQNLTMTATRNARAGSTSATRRTRRDHGGTLLGIFIGLVIGLGTAASVAFWVMKNNPTLQSPVAAANGREPAKEVTRNARGDAAEKPRFDFYRILPGVEETRAQPERKTVAEPKERAASKAAETARPPERVAEASAERAPAVVASVEPSRSAKGAEKFWLQAGSFST